tara:strand:+ start:1503 stop:2474 length:972 start_codon:yes stop_codon:yes gene_type:complete
VSAALATHHDPLRALLEGSLRARFQFEWGELDDRTVWARLPDQSVVRLGREGLHLLLDLDAGREREAALTRYGLSREEFEGILARVAMGGGVRPTGEGYGKITRAAPQADRRLAPWLLLALPLAILHAEYLASYARTALLQTWADGLLVLGLGLVAAMLHELGHYFAARPYFRPTFGFTWLGWFPAVYADTQQAWTLPRGIRLRISAAGVLVDLWVNALLILLVVANPALEYYATPFLLAQLARWSLTLNPFFDGDGYWLLCDGLRITNLRTYAKQRLAEGRRDVFSLYALVSLGLGLLSLVGLVLLVWNVLGNAALAAGLLR